MRPAKPEPAVSGERAALEDVYLLPGGAHLALAPTRVTTVLGSCVAVCLIDRRLRIGGMNHFLLPGLPPPGETEPLRWGETATEALVLDLLRAGTTTATLEAKVFGGAHVGQPRTGLGVRIGARNAETAFAVLARMGIRVVGRAVGGAFGRKLIFESHTGVAWMKELCDDRP